MVEYDNDDKSVNRDITFGRWLSIVVCSAILLGALWMLL
jgi:hypothetical protein